MTQVAWATLVVSVLLLASVSAEIPQWEEWTGDTQHELCQEYGFGYSAAVYAWYDAQYQLVDGPRPGYLINLTHNSTSVSVQSNLEFGGALLLTPQQLDSFFDVFVEVVPIGSTQAELPTGALFIILCMPDNEDGNTPIPPIEIPEWNVVGGGLLAISALGLLALRKRR